MQLKGSVQCAHDKGRGRTQCTAALIVKVVCVWMVGSRATTDLHKLVLRETAVKKYFIYSIYSQNYANINMSI
jgi:hypothetical protein